MKTMLPGIRGLVSPGTEFLLRKIFACSIVASALAPSSPFGICQKETEKNEIKKLKKGEGKKKQRKGTETKKGKEGKEIKKGRK